MSKFSEKKIIDEIRLLALDMISNNGTRHNGFSLSSAPILYSLFANHLEFDLEKKDYPNRDRFIMSKEHNSALLYATMYATCEEYTIDELKTYGKINSPVPSSLELNTNHRIESTSGISGEGLATAVGLAMAEKHLEGKYNTKKDELFNYKIYSLCGDSDMMEGISYEAASLAGKYNLDNLIVLYDSNGMTQDEELDDDYQDKIIDMYVALGWDVLVIKNGEKLSEIDKAIETAKKSKMPVLIVVDNHKYMENIFVKKIYQSSTQDNIISYKEDLEINNKFEIDEDLLEVVRKNVRTRTQKRYSDWYDIYKKYTENLSEEDSNKLNSFINDESITLEVDKVIDREKLFLDKPMIDINYQIMNVISNFIDSFMGGTASKTLKTKTLLKKSEEYTKDNYKGKNIKFGTRENVMSAILNGFALTNFRPFASTFLALSDNMKSSIRSTCMMKLPVTYIFTHDTFQIEEIGPYLKPVEQSAMLRSIPNLDVYRPCDYKELMGSWNLILKNKRPSALIVSNQVTESYKFTSIEEVSLGGYVISEVKNRLDVILIASGSELTLAMKLKHELLKNFIEARVVSMPNIKDFLKQSQEYQNQVLPKGYKRMAIEFSNDPSIYKIIKADEDIININNYIKSGTNEELLNEYELDMASIIIRIKNNI